MTVALLGIGADSTNVSPVPPVYADNSFEYLPIPESDPTVESKTYGSIKLRHQERSAAEFFDKIDPSGNGEHTVTGNRMEEWPVHHDPNFDALTYGETGSRPAYTKLLRSLEQGDMIAFYTGLKNEQSHSYTHRYLIGYMTVNSVCDIQRISDRIGTRKEATNIKDTFRENAHIKRFNASGKIDKEAVLVDGESPGGRLEKAIRISKHQGRGHHYMTDKAQQLLQPVPGGNRDRNAYLGGIKKAHKLQIESQSFLSWVERHTTTVPDGYWLRT